MIELTVGYMVKDELAPPDFNGCWVARFKDKGLTAYGNTIQMAIDKLLLMLKTEQEVT